MIWGNERAQCVFHFLLAPPWFDFQSTNGPQNMLLVILYGCWFIFEEMEEESSYPYPMSFPYL